MDYKNFTTDIRILDKKIIQVIVLLVNTLTVIFLLFLDEGKIINGRKYSLGECVRKISFFHSMFPKYIL